MAQIEYFYQHMENVIYACRGYYGSDYSRNGECDIIGITGEIENDELPKITDLVFSETISNDWNLKIGTSSITGLPELTYQNSGHSFRVTRFIRIDDTTIYGGGNDVITSITLPNSVTNIGENAFNSMVALQRVTANNVSKINSQVFYFCLSLKEININPNFTSIDSNAFYNCTNIPSFYIPFSCKSISEDAFNGAYFDELIIDNYKGAIPNERWGLSWSSKITYLRIPKCYFYIKTENGIIPITLYTNDNGKAVKTQFYYRT